MLSNIFDRISFWSLFVVIVLLPIFFLPFTQIPIETSKGLLFVMGLAISIIFWIAARFSDGKINLPKSWLLLSAFGVLLVFLISALFSSALQVSLFGIMLDVGTFYFMLGAFLLMLLSSIVLKDIKNAKTVFWGIIISSAVLFLFQSLRLFMPDLLSLGILGGKTDNILGSWNALGLFTGFSTIMSLFIVEFFSVPKGIKWLLGVLIAFSVVLSAVVNFPLIWEILGIFALIIFIYKISFSFGRKQEEGSEKKHFPAFSFAVVMVSLLFFMSGQFIGELLPNSLNLSNIEIRPSFGATMSITGKALMKDPILGVGPNKFGEVWAMHKPQVINATQFWDTSFNSGSGLLPTFASTTGSLGILAWLTFFILFIMIGAKSLFASIKNNMNWEVVVFFVASLYLFVSSFFYSTGEVMFLLAFAFTGIFIGLSSAGRSNGEISMSFLDDPRKSFFSIFFLVILMIISAAVGFKYVERLASVTYFGKTLSASTIPMAEDSITKAISLHQNDLYLRTYTQVYLTKINSIVTKGSALSETDKADLQTSFDQAVNGAQLAVAYNSENYLNYNSLGAVYNTVGLLGVKGTYDKAIEAYKTASTLNPLNPGIKLATARVYFADGKIKEAKDFVKEALSLKPDYIEALITISQIEKSDGNNTVAISYAETALSLAPDSQDLIQYVNSLKGGSSTPSTTNNDKTGQQ
ncbi:MAG: Tetratricopeptide repeat domain protein [Candidatus Nomurabacteria bacterium GW2011_GWF2_35_12]|uniref:Tetratricopeptide repeat domain protein n=3 Tax=Candidatus Nomuraibacteriota TaxID=1752729 RepID=A0A0G0EBW1_9BACT|nr:MAG: Tetratricopeptide repeat domain protein [Candidatus Nomurabacteria bacterium GW2011_GWF2_35_12]KKP73033.1 MAG: Tetratricopeptide repeat domain protein [Candidatus Nomurabacteria bacterium GW2011_GWB1_35_20]KKP76374.1 MAG: Tetratricopeptide repeat domain protein [Parcubacteria group bacterium GW2011_GWC1_35_21]KKP78294.1 MAG: Tetratricopeptide repeat domain protein [Candidatus Nomurabacteria bacterium GW2011_GWC2_35_35]KKP84578.1 MAG: Tetratricopeptide repeat domain protein [Parcubacteri